LYPRDVFEIVRVEFFIFVVSADRHLTFHLLVVMPPLLSSSESEDETDTPQESFKINESYAKRLEHNKAREELHRLQAKYGDRAQKEDKDDEEEESSTSQSEDELGELVTPQLDAEIWRTIAMIRERRPEVYDESWKGFTEDTDEPVEREKKEKVCTSVYKLIIANVFERLSSKEFTCWF
jgi:hypothetical protein